MMKDNHVAGEGNAYYTLFREYDPDLGRWWRPNPIFQPWQSPYSAFDGNPIMLTDVWGLEAEKDPLKGFTPEDPLITPDVVVTADALEGTRKSAVDILGRRAYNLETNPFKKMDYIKHNGEWVSSLEYDNAMSKLINGLDQKGYDPILHGFDFDEEMSDNFWSMFNAKAARKYKLERLPHTGEINPFFAGHGLEDNSQEMVGLLGIAGTLFNKTIGWLAGRLRQQYVAEVLSIKNIAADLKQKGLTEEAIARYCNSYRRQLGIKYKDLTPPAERAKIYKRNLKLYEDKLGPTADWLRYRKGKSWGEIIESSSRPGGKDLGY